MSHPRLVLIHSIAKKSRLDANRVRYLSIAMRERLILGFAIWVQLERSKSFSNVCYGNSVEIFCGDCAKYWVIIMIDEAAFELRDCSIHEDCVFYEIEMLCSKTWRSCLHTVIFISWFWFWSLVKMTRMTSTTAGINPFHGVSAKQCDIHD